MERFLVSAEPFNEEQKVSTSKLPLKRKPIPPPSITHLKTLPAHQGGIRIANKHLLSTLKDPKNPITHADTCDRTEHVATWASGHESGNSRSGTGWNELRRAKLLVQSNDRGKESGIFKGVKAYLNGCTGGITNLALISLIQKNGGEVRMMPSAKCTHILSTTWLSGSKTERFLTRNKNPIQVVHPHWIVESIKFGKRLQEYNYSVIFHENQQSISSILGRRPDIRKSRASSHTAFGDVKNEDTIINTSYNTVKLEERETMKVKREEVGGVVVLDDSDRFEETIDKVLKAEEEGEEGEDDDEEEEEEEVTDWEFPPCGQSGQRT